MAATVRAQFPSGAASATTGTTSATTSLTVVAGDVLVCHLILDAGSDTGMSASVTANSVSPDGSTAAIHTNGQTAGFTQAFYWVAPAAGTYNGVVSISGGTPGGIATKWFAIAGSNGSAPVTSTFAPSGAGTTASCSITSGTIQTNGIGLAMFGGGTGFSSTGQTTLNLAGVTSSSAACGDMAESSQAGAGSTVTFTATMGGADWYAAIAMVFAPAGAVNTATGLFNPWNLAPPGLASPVAIRESPFTPDLLGATNAPPSGPPFVCGVDASQRYFTDQYGAPIFPIIDHQWNMIARYGEWNETGVGTTTPASVFAAYASRQAGNGINASLFLAIGGNTGGGGGPNTNGNTWDGVAPWGAGGIGDLNPTYWARVDSAISALAAQGITAYVNLISSYALGTGTAFASLNVTNAATYGAALAARYKTSPNIVWCFGADYFGIYENEFAAVIDALRSAGDQHLITIEYMAESETSQDSGGTATGATGRSSRMNYRDVYSYNAGYFQVEQSYGLSTNPSTLPTLYFNGWYDTATGSIDTVMLDDRLWALTSGSLGWFYGSEATWAWPSTAYSDLNSDTFPNTWIPAFRTWISSVTGWQNLIPDISSSWITSARGTKVTALASGGGATPYSGGNTYLTGAKTADGTLAVIYTPTSRTITIASAVGNTATWVDPYSFATTSATGGATSYTTPGNNSQGNTRWLLVLSQSAGPATVTGSATLATTANLTTSASVTEIASATLATTAGLTTAAVVTTSGTASLATTANLAAAGAITAVGSATLATTASLVTSGLAQQIAAVSLGVTANLATSALDTALASSSLATTANLSTSGSIGGLSSATLATTANLVTSASVLEVASALLGTTANLTTTGLDTSFGSASLATVANLATSGSVAGANSALLLVTANLLASGLDTDIASAILATTANLATSGTRILPASALLAATANLSTSGVIGGAASATLPVTANLTATGAVTDVALALLAVTASLTANGRATTTGAALFQTIANLIAFGTIGVLPTFGYALPGTAASGPTAQQGTAPSGPTATRGSN